jgi:branched-chain amino acid transport system permease protein
MVVIGGLGSVHGAFLGAIFLITMPQLISLGKDYLPDAIGQAPGLQAAVYGVVLIAFVLFEPHGPVRPLAEDPHLLPDVPVLPQGHVQAAEVFQKSDRLK